MDSVLNGKGLSFSVEISRQGGKNELSARLETLLLTAFGGTGGDIVKCSPTFRPQARISIERLEKMLSIFGFKGRYANTGGYIIQLGFARCLFLSADRQSNVVGHTAGLLLEVDEAQDVDKDKFRKEFAPMASSTNATTVFYGTAWDDFSLLEEVKQSNLEAARKDGVQRHFSFDWHEVSKYNPAYGDFVEKEQSRLGDEHPLFRTQYRLLTISDGGRLLSDSQCALLHGSHPRLLAPASSIGVSSSIPQGGVGSIGVSPVGTVRTVSPVKHTSYIAGLDLAGQAYFGTEDLVSRSIPRRDAVVLSIAEITPSDDPLLKLPSINVVQLYSWHGEPYPSLYAKLLEIVRFWGIARLVVDSTGMGEPFAAFLKSSLGSRVVPFVFSQSSKSRLGYNFLSFINSGRLKLFAADNSSEYASLGRELRLARAVYRPNQTMNFFVDPSEGHDDFLMSLALSVFLAADVHPRKATGGTKKE